MEAATQREIRVGVIGADTKTSWAKVSHVPAINDLQGLRLAAVATRNEQSAREAAKAFGADRWYSDPFAMIRDDRIDIVTVAVAVPARSAHAAIVRSTRPALCRPTETVHPGPRVKAWGKNGPSGSLGRSVAEAEEMVNATHSLHTAIGLQGRLNPAVRRAAELVSSGKIGRPLNARIVSQTLAFGPEMPVAQEYYIKRSSGANLLTIAGGHTLDLVEAVLGKIIEVDARAEIRWPIVRLIETGVESVRETADYVGILGKTASGAAFTAEIEAGVPPDNVRFSVEVRGSDGWLSLTSSHPGGVQIGDLKLRSSVAFAEPDAPAVSDNIMETAINVGEVYAQLARDLNEGTYRTPGFREALHNSSLVEAVRRSAEGGVRQKVIKAGS